MCSSFLSNFCFFSSPSLELLLSHLDFDFFQSFLRRLSAIMILFLPPKPPNMKRRGKKEPTFYVWHLFHQRSWTFSGVEQYPMLVCPCLAIISSAANHSTEQYSNELRMREWIEFQFIWISFQIIIWCGPCHKTVVDLSFSYMTRKIFSSCQWVQLEIF